MPNRIPITAYVAEVLRQIKDTHIIENGWVG